MKKKISKFATMFNSYVTSSWVYNVRDTRTTKRFSIFRITSLHRITLLWNLQKTSFMQMPGTMYQLMTRHKWTDSQALNKLSIRLIPELWPIKFSSFCKNLVLPPNSRIRKTYASEWTKWKKAFHSLDRNS